MSHAYKPIIHTSPRKLPFWTASFIFHYLFVFLRVFVHPHLMDTNHSFPCNIMANTHFITHFNRCLCMISVKYILYIPLTYSRTLFVSFFVRSYLEHSFLCHLATGKRCYFNFGNGCLITWMKVLYYFVFILYTELITIFVLNEIPILFIVWEMVLYDKL